LKYFSDALQLPPSKVCAVDHHLAHAYSTLPNIRPWGQALVFTLDGWGDGLCATVNLCRDGKLERISASGDMHSLGTYYRLTTSLLGLRALGDEYKVMGLAAYAKPSQYEALASELLSLLRINEAGEWESSCSGIRLRGELERIYRFKRFDHIAGAIQHVAEKLVREWVLYWIRKTSCGNVALAGGVFMNVKVSQVLAGSEGVQRLFVMPSAGDESNAIGCAIWAAATRDASTPLKPLQSLYLGMEFGASDVDLALKRTEASSRYRIEKIENINREVGKLLAANRIVARCSGRMEFGARALGNRSILANPADPLNVNRINEAIKSRDFWMPFAPSILAEDMARYVKKSERIFAPYMCIAFHSTPEAQRELRAAIHPTDLTLRPQAVTREWNPEYHEIIRTFKEQTGIGGVLNTSFNLHGEPIVCSPDDAISASDRSGLTHLVLGNTLLTKLPIDDGDKKHS
jgi:carbamoyltransferase